MGYFDPEATTLNEIVERRPEALEVLGRHGLDTCCGGALPLAEAARRHGVDVAALVEELQAAKPASSPGVDS